MQGVRAVAVIGAGAVGLSVALALARLGNRDGPSITVIDENPAATGASKGNAGVIVAGGAVPLILPGVMGEAMRMLMGADRALRIAPGHLPRLLPWLRRAMATANEHDAVHGAAALEQLAAPSADHWRADLAEAGASALIGDSLFIHATRGPQPDMEAIAWQLKRAEGVGLIALDRAMLAEIEPALSPDYGHAIAMEGMARLHDPEAAGKALQRAAASLGTAMLQARVTGIARDGTNWQITTTQRRLEADLVVVAAGWASRALLSSLGVDIPLEAEHGRHVTLPWAETDIRNSVMDSGARMVASRMANGVRLAGSSAFTGPGRPPDPEDDLPAMLQIAERMFPGIDTEGAIPWAGSRPSLPDSIPVIGPVPGHPGLWAAFGHGHYGMTMAPATGRLIASMIAGARPTVDPRPYDPARFA
ncbi:MAG: FAD-dependent oxidoreductase [Pseudomonadota bacterium]